MKVISSIVLGALVLTLPVSVAGLESGSVTAGPIAAPGPAIAVVSENSEVHQGRLTGRVTNSAGQPLEGITVQARERGAQSLGPVMVAVTDSSGQYAFDHLETTAYLVYIQEDEYVFEAWDRGYFLFSLWKDDANPVGVVDGETTAGIDFRLKRLASLLVTGLEGHFADIEILDATGQSVFPNLDGTLNPGTYYVRTEPYGFLNELYDRVPCPGTRPEYCDLTLATPVVLSEGEVRTLHMPPRPGSGFRGTIRDAATGDLVEAQLWVFDSAGRAIGLYFASFGEYDIKDLPPGDYYLLAGGAENGEDYGAVLFPNIPCGPGFPNGESVACDPLAGGKITVVEESQLEGVDISLPVGGTLVVNGTLDGIEISVQAEIWNSEGRLVARTTRNSHHVGSTVVKGLPVGQYYVASRGGGTSQDEFNDGRLCHRNVEGGCDPLGGVPIAVTALATTNLDFSLLSYGTVSGRVTSLGPQQVNAWNVAGTLVERAWATPERPDFEFKVLPPGDYRFSTSFPEFGNSNSVEELYDGIPCLGGPGVGCDLEEGAIVTIPARESVENIDFNLGPGPEITGVIKLRTNQTPEDWAIVDVFDSEGRLVREVFVDDEGHYRAGGLSPGDYRVLAVPYNPGLLSNLHGMGSCGDCDPLGGEPVTVAGDVDAVHIDFELESRLSFCSEPGHACLLDNRFLVEGTMKDLSVPPQSFEIRPMNFEGGRAESGQAAFFESFNPGNFELGVKMVDGCSLPEVSPLHAYWVFIGGLTNAESRVDVVDTVTGDSLSWINPAGEFPTSYANTAAFACVDGTPSCSRSDEAACLLDGRFRVSGVMEDFQSPPTVFPARVMSFASEKAVSRQAAFFESFSPGNFELGVKMVDACDLDLGDPLRGYWTFYGGLTNAETELSVTQLGTGAIDRFTVAGGNPPTSVGRIHAFDCE